MGEDRIMTERCRCWWEEDDKRGKPAARTVGTRKTSRGGRGTYTVYVQQWPLINLESSGERRLDAAVYT